MIDQIIKWKPQINHVATKISKSIGVMYILALLLESTTLLLMVISLSQDGMGEELNGRIAMHPWTQTTQFVQRHYARERLQLTSQLKRKVILYPEPSNLGNPSFYLCIDFNKNNFMEVSVPFYPEAEEYVNVQGRKSTSLVCQSHRKKNHARQRRILMLSHDTLRDNHIYV